MDILPLHGGVRGHLSDHQMVPPENQAHSTRPTEFAKGLLYSKHRGGRKEEEGSEAVGRGRATTTLAFPQKILKGGLPSQQFSKKQQWTQRTPSPTPKSLSETVFWGFPCKAILGGILLAPCPCRCISKRGNRGLCIPPSSDLQSCTPPAITLLKAVFLVQLTAMSGAGSEYCTHSIFPAGNGPEWEAQT